MITPEESKLLFHISRIVEKQVENQEKLERDLIEMKLAFTELRLKGNIKTDQEITTSQIKTATLGGSLGSALLYFFQWLMDQFTR